MPGTEDEPASLRSLRPIFGERRASIVLLVAVQAVSHSVAIAYPRVVEYAVDVASDRPTALPDALPNIGGVLLGLFLLGTTLSWFSEYWGVRLSEEIACAVRVRAMEGVYAQSVAVLEEIVPSEIVDRLSRDAASVARLLQMGLGGAATVLQALLAVVMMLSIDSWMSMLSLCIIPVIGVAVLLLGRVMQSASARHRQAEVAASQVVGEMFRGVRVIQAFSQVERELERYRGAARQASTAIRPVGRWSGMMRSLGEFATAALVTIVAVLGTSRLVEGQLSTGSLTAFLMYTYMLIMAVSMAASQFGAVRRMLGSTRPLIRMLELPRGSRPRRAAKSDDRHSADRFAIDLLTYAYPSRPLSPVVNGVSFELRSGEMLAIVGRSGAGKSTLVKLLLQFIQPTFGRIWLGGREYQDVDPKAWRRHIGYVEQEPTLMTGNIAYNIAYGRPDASEEDIKEAARRAHIHDVIDGLPEGYETHVGDTGTRLSGGQKQRLALARALLLEPDVLILDEPASHLDSESEAAVSASIEEFRANGGMVIIIAHGLKSIQGAAQILVMDKGHPVGLGNHVDLMRENPSYRYLAELQMAEEELEVEVTALFQERALIDDP